jgi:hypothetical protein
VPVLTKLPCGHEKELDCQTSQDETEVAGVMCQERCSKTLQCGHVCTRECCKPCDPCHVSLYAYHIPIGGLKFQSRDNEHFASEFNPGTQNTETKQGFVL